MVAIGTNDLSHVGQLMDVSARFAGAVVSFIVVAVILLQTSVTLGLVVLLGVPLLMLGITPILGPLQRRSAHQRHLMGDLSNTASDIVGGLRVLRGIGGEQVFPDRYRRESQDTRQAGVQVARIQSVLDALQVFLPGLFVVVVVWIGARYAVEGTITPGELVAFYGYSAFLMIPLRTATEYANKIIRARVAAVRICRVLALDPEVGEPALLAPSPAPGADLHDERTGLRVRPGLLTAIVSEQPDESAAARRPARHGRLARSTTRSASAGPAHVAAPGGGPAADRGLRHRGSLLLRPPRRPASTSPATATSRAPSTPPRRPTSSSRCPTASTRSSPSGAGASPAASASGWCWPAPWPPTPRSWCWSSRPRRSTPTPRPGSRPACAATAPAGRPWSPPAAR